MTLPDLVSVDREELSALRLRLSEAEETLRAIREGEVDALVVRGSSQDEVFALGDGEQSYRAFMEAMDLGAAALDRDRRVIYANAALCRLLGVSRDDLQQVALGDAFDPALASAIEDLIARAGKDQQSAPATLNLEVGRRHIEVGIASLPLSFGHGYAVTFTDVTERVNTERNRAQGVLDSMGDAFMLYDPRFELLDINAEALRLDGREREALVGRTIWDLYPDLEHSDLGRMFARAMEDGQPASLQHRHTWPTGQQRWFETRAFPVDEGLAVFFRDVSDRRDTEARLIEERERVQLALAAGAIIGTWMWHLPSDRFTVDEQFAVNFGLDPALGYEGLSLEQVIETVHPDDKQGLREAIDDVVRRGGPFAHQYRVRRADGRYYWIEANGRVDQDADGTPLRFPGVLLNVEQWRAVEAERDRANVLLRTFTEAVPGVAYAKDRDGRMLVANRGTARLIGKPLDQIIGRTDGEFLADKAQAAVVMANDQRIIASGVMEQIEEDIDLPDGSRAVWLSTKAPLLDASGHVVGLIGSSLDITDRKLAEEALQDLNDTLEQRVTEALAERKLWIDVFESSDAVIAAFDRDYRILALNRPYAELCEAIYGVRPKVGDKVDAMLAHLPAELEAVRGVIGRALAGEDFTVVEEFGDPARRRTWFEIRFNALRGRTGELIGAFQYAYDITDRLRAQAKLAETEEALRQSQKMEAVGQLTGGIAHDFNNMLAVVIGSLDLAARRLGPDDSRVKRYIAAASEGAERAANLTQRLLAFSRQQPLRPESIDSNRLVAGMSDLLRHSLGGAVALETALTRGLWRIHADPNQLENVILNLAVNARDAMPDGGTLTIATQNARLGGMDVADEPDVARGEYVLIAVSDTGEGMSPDVIAKAFDPFFTTKEVGKGTGLGLSQVYGFVRQSGGHVKICSELGQGTTVNIYLPRMLEEGASADEAHEAGDMPLGEQSEVVLVVEDERAVRQFSVAALGELGYQVLEAESAATALRILDTHPEIALLFTDVVMPEVNGRKLADEALRRRPDLKVLFTTGYTRDAVVHNGVLDAGVALIGKPYSIEQLAAKVRDVLDNG
jgi:PAS domain S-box-containing protein